MDFFIGMKKWFLVILISASAVFAEYSYTCKIREVAEVAVYYWGSSGNTVAQIQQRLKDLGYYSDNVDGIFGENTYYAVVSFQSANGLVPDGIVGNETLNRLGISTEEFEEDDLYILASVINGEGRGEPYTGQVAIGAVVLNRVRSELFPNSVAEVVYQSGAFDSVRDGQINLSPSESALRAAQDALNGWDPTDGALYFWNPATATSKWIWSIPIKLQIGRHVFG
ncbi:MAG: spore cortex-lytic enzyme [Clostridia bacterium]|nr:spore cortex-lytic enzyme [Clostridia bacterium]